MKFGLFTDKKPSFAMCNIYQLMKLNCEVVDDFFLLFYNCNFITQAIN